MSIEIDGLGELLEKDLLPYPDIVTWNGREVEQVQASFMDKVQHYAWNFFKFSIHTLFLPLACMSSMVKYAVRLIQGKKEETWNPPTEALENPSSAIPDHFGFSTSMYQDSGLGTRFAATPLVGECDWNEWLSPEHIEGSDTNYGRFFFDILRDPNTYIQILKSQNVNAHRFSLEWAVIEPQPGVYDMEAVELYRNFIRELKNNGIEPYVTLHHFVCPKWFKETGGFGNLDNIEIFKNHALSMMEMFPEVTHWMPFNEINVDGFQKCVRGVYPPGKEGDIAGAGRMMRNMLITHCQIYKEAKERWPDLKIGSSHQWLKFEPHNGNFIEELVCHFMSKITHYACYDFFKTGQFAMEVPGVANIQFAIPKEEFERHQGFCDFLGVQFYGYVPLMIGSNGGEDYPGFGINNFTFPSLGVGVTFGATCQKGGATQSFGPPFYPESLDKCLTEAIEIVKPFPGKTLVITETGCDARVWKFGEEGWTVDTNVQKEYFERIFPILEKFKEHISGLFAWTLADGDEWERADTPILNLGKMHKVEGKIQRYEPHPAADRLREVFGEKLAEMRRASAAA